MSSNTLQVERTIKATAAEAYRAFTRSIALREWCSDGATVNPRPGGHIFLYWHSGYYAAGEYTALEPERRVAFTWQGRGEPGPTEVEVWIAPEEGPDSTGSVTVRLEHRGFGEGSDWDKARTAAEKGWGAGLENLHSALETGQDLRYVRRPMLGIYLGEFSPEIAARLGVPVQEGTRLDGVVEGMGAQGAGLKADDVIVAVEGRPTTDFTALVAALQPYRAGDTVTVEYYRGAERRTTQMTLSGRPIPEVPGEPAALAAAVRQSYKEAMMDLEGCLAGATDEEAAHRSGPGEWNVLETMAHLIIHEREHQAWMGDLLMDDERWGDGNDNPEVVSARIQAIVGAYPTLAEMLEALKASQAETVGMIAALPPEFMARRDSYWRLGQALLTNIQPPNHLQEHAKQIKAAISCGREEREP